MIPKIIHYCWFGKGDKSELTKKCIDSWSVLCNNNFTLIEWNENNFDLTQNSIVYKAYCDRKFAFVSDYVRLKVLYEMGGLYLDTDVEVFKDFTPLLDCSLLLGMIYDASIGTAVIGCEKENPIIFGLLNCYTNAQYPISNSENQYFIFNEFKDFSNKIVNNNDLFTAYFLKNIRSFRLNGKKQKIGSTHIYSKNFFEGESFFHKSNYSRHYAEGSWLKKPSKGSSLKEQIKQLIKKDIILTKIIYDYIYRHRMNKKVPFFSYYKLD